MHARNSFKNNVFWKKIIKKALKKQLYFFFQTKSLLMYKVSKNKRGLELVALQVTTQVQKKSFICYILSDQAWWCNVKQFLSYSKNYTWKFMQVNSWHHKLFHFHLSFWIWKVWKGREKVIKIWIFREQKELFKWNKKHFS